MRSGHRPSRNRALGPAQNCQSDLAHRIIKATIASAAMVHRTIPAHPQISAAVVRPVAPVVFRSRHVTVFGVPDPQPLVTGPFPGRVLRLAPTRAVISVGGPGTYRVATRFSPYWHTSRGCLSEGADRMLALSVPRAGRVALRLELSVSRGFEVLAGSVDRSICAG
jgi:hypothetical protein